MSDVTTNYDYVEELSIDPELKCLICQCPFSEPVTTDCHHTFCQLCIEEWIKEQPTCPACRQEIKNTNKDLNIPKLTPVNCRLVFNMLDRLLVICKSCKESNITRGNYNVHLKKCPKAIVNCMANDIECSWMGARDEYPIHQKQCPYEALRPILSSLLNECKQLREQIQQIPYLQSQLTEQIMQNELKQKEIDELHTNNQLLRYRNRELLDQLELRSTQVMNETSTVATQLVNIYRIVTFDNIPDAKTHGQGNIPDGYADMSWSNAEYLHKTYAEKYYSAKGYMNAFLGNRKCIVVNVIDNRGHEKPLHVRPSQWRHRFSLVSFEALSIYRDNLELRIIGRRAKQDIFSKIVKLQVEKLQLFDLEKPWTNIDEFIITILESNSSGNRLNRQRKFGLTCLYFE